MNDNWDSLSAATKPPLFLGTGMRETGDYSEATSEIIDIEIRDSIRPRVRTCAGDTSARSKDILIQGARLLLEKEKLDGEEIRAAHWGHRSRKGGHSGRSMNWLFSRNPD